MSGIPAEPRAEAPPRRMFAAAPPPAWSAPGQGSAPPPTPPGWTPPAPFPPPVTEPQARHHVPAITALGLLIAGVVIGAAGSALVTRRTVTTADLHVSAGSVPGDATTAESVANTLGPATGTIVAILAGNNDALGSGFVVAHDGSLSYLVTNNHVVADARSLHLVMPGSRILVATLVGTDALDDIAVVSVPDNSLPIATWGPSHDLRVGQPVVAIGSPLGNEGSVTVGVISALHRTISAGGETGTQSETLQDVLQTDASINPGNSGGPLADAEGRVVGVNVAVAGNGASNIGFSIPSDVAHRVAEELISHQAVGHPYLGIAYYSPVDAIEAGVTFAGPGVYVSQVQAGTPADRAGFKVGDVLEAVDGTEIDNGQTLGGLIQLHAVGDTVHFTVQRGSQTMTLTATLVDRPAD